MTTIKLEVVCQKGDRVVSRSSKGCLRGFIGPFLSHDKLFPESCQNKMTTPEVVNVPKGCHRVVIVC